MKDVEIFNSPIFGELRTSRNDDGEYLFCLADVCKSLGLETNKVRGRLSSPHPLTIPVGVVTGQKADGTEAIQQKDMYFITEPNLYRCIFQSRKPSARKFQDWVFDEVLPALRKEGAYVVATQQDDDETLMAKAVIAAQKAIKRNEERMKALEAQNQMQAEQIELQKKEIAVSAPKAKYYDDTLASQDCITSTQVADDLGISAKALNQKLAAAKIIYFQSDQWHLCMPYKSWNLHGTRTHNYFKRDGSIGTKVNLVWNQRGKRFILALFNNNFNVKAALVEINEASKAMAPAIATATVTISNN